MTPATASGVKLDDFSAGMLMNSLLVGQIVCAGGMYMAMKIKVLLNCAEPEWWRGAFVQD